MSERALAFVDEWISGHIHAQDADGDILVQGHLGPPSMCSRRSAQVCWQYITALS
jgi:hypothetical protein